jgi:polysaccharide pyruvyl transferase WcaK-like protein
LTRVTLINETGHTVNPGCKAVQRALESLVKRAGGSIVESVPVGYWADAFRDIAVNSKDGILYREGWFPTGSPSARPIDLDQWKKVRTAVAAQDSELTEKVRKSDVVLVNGEGTIHHNFSRALALLALIDVSSSLDKPVLLLNAGIQAMDAALLQLVLPHLRMCHVRERFSLESVRSYVPHALQTADIAALSIGQLPAVRSFAPVRIRKKGFVSGGVATSEETLRSILATVRSFGVEPTYYCIGDGGEKAIAIKVCTEMNVKIVFCTKVTLDELPSFVSKFDIAVCGRHHINFVLMKCGIPLVPIVANTWKIEGTFALLGYPLEPVRRVDQLAAALEEVWNNRRLFRDAGQLCFRRALASAGALEERFTDLFAKAA